MGKFFDELDRAETGPATDPGSTGGSINLTAPCANCGDQVPQPGEHLDPESSDYWCVRA